jgi:DNA-binding MarR family transcriptional regulator
MDFSLQIQLKQVQSANTNIHKDMVRASQKTRTRGIICALAIEYLGISGREVSRQLHLSPLAVSKLLQRGRKNGLMEKLSGALFRRHW